MPEMTLALAKNFLDDLKIPSQPEILLAVQNEIAKENPDLGIVSDYIIQDGGLFSSVLKLINSPYFGMRCEIKTVQHAVSLIGIDRLTTNIACIKFREQMSGSNYIPMPTYWEISISTAKLCSYLSKELSISSATEAYAFGLFKDAGIPILAQKYSNYKDVLTQQNDTELRSFTDLEDENFNTNHAIVSYMVSKKWGMDKSFREACLYHHDIDYIIADNFAYDEEARKLILLSKVAEYVTNLKREQDDYEWPKIKEFVFYYFGLSDEEFTKLCAQMLSHIL
jgi:HD-like signal output (HDOD) protein